VEETVLNLGAIHPTRPISLVSSLPASSQKPVAMAISKLPLAVFPTIATLLSLPS